MEISIVTFLSTTIAMACVLAAITLTGESSLFFILFTAATVRHILEAFLDFTSNTLKIIFFAWIVYSLIVVLNFLIISPSTDKQLGSWSSEIIPYILIILGFCIAVIAMIADEKQESRYFSYLFVTTIMGVYLWWAGAFNDTYIGTLDIAPDFVISEYGYLTLLITFVIVLLHAIVSSVLGAKKPKIILPDQPDKTDNPFIELIAYIYYIIHAILSVFFQATTGVIKYFANIAYELGKNIIQVLPVRVLSQLIKFMKRVVIPLVTFLFVFTIYFEFADRLMVYFHEDPNFLPVLAFSLLYVIASLGGISLSIAAFLWGHQELNEVWQIFYRHSAG